MLVSLELDDLVQAGSSEKWGAGPGLASSPLGSPRSQIGRIEVYLISSEVNQLDRPEAMPCRSLPQHTLSPAFWGCPIHICNRSRFRSSAQSPNRGVFRGPGSDIFRRVDGLGRRWLHHHGRLADAVRQLIAALTQRIIEWMRLSVRAQLTA